MPNNKRPPIKSLITALAEAHPDPEFEATAKVAVFTKRLAHVGREADGAISLVYYRGFQAGYEQAMRDAKSKGGMRKEHAFSPRRAEKQK